MSMKKSVFGFVLAAGVAVGCGPGEIDGESILNPLRPMGYGGANSHIREGAVLSGTRITGIYHSTAAQTGTGIVSPTDWWVSTTGTDLYAPITSITYRTEQVTALASSQGVLSVSTGTGLQPVETKNTALVFEVGAPLNSSVRITSAVAGDGYQKYVAQSLSSATGEWESFCPHPYKQADGTQIQLTEYMVPVAGVKWAFNGSQSDDVAAIRMSCTHDFVGGCIEWGYAPWKTNSDGISLKETHQACGRMKREDICGNGEPVTTSGLSYDQHTNIEMWDSAGIHAMQPHTLATKEAGWNANGATCFNPGKYRSKDPVLNQRLAIQLGICPKKACTALDAVQGIVGSARPCTSLDLSGKCIAN